jgi:type I restriction enzyme S subunit
MSEKSLPPGWAWTTLEDTCETIMGQSPPSETYNDERIGLPFYQGKAEFGDLYPTPVKWCSHPGKIAEAGDILISVRAPVGPTNLCREQSCIGRGLAAIRPEAKMGNLYFLHWLRYVEKEWDSKATGTTFKAISGGILRAQEVPLPPLAEQQRIVAEIEKQLTRLDAGVAALRRARAKLKRYKAAVLKAACEGRLVPQDPADEPASALLRRILAERRRKWEAEQIARGKDPRKLRYEEPASPDTKKLLKLPKGWVWATVEQLNPATRPCAYGVLQPGLDIEDGIFLVRVGDIENGKVYTENIKQIDPQIAAKYPRTKLMGGEVLISLVGAIGRTAVVPRSLVGANTARAVGVIPLTEYIQAPWVEIWFRNPDKVREMTSKAHEVARKTLNLEDVRAALVALPPLTEQQRIVAEIERRLSVVEELEAAVETNLARAGRLRQSILKRAFEGKLVPQDPADEPAAVLLERIRAERERRGVEGKRQPAATQTQPRLPHL